MVNNSLTYSLLFFLLPPYFDGLPPGLGLRRFLNFIFPDGLPPPVGPLLSPAVGSFRRGSSSVAADRYVSSHFLSIETGGAVGPGGGWGAGGGWGVGVLGVLGCWGGCWF